MGMSSENLQPDQYKRLRATLVDAFDEDSLVQTIRNALGKHPGKLNLRTAPLASAVDDLIEYLDKTSEWGSFLKECKIKDNASPALINLCDEMIPLLTIPEAVGTTEKPVNEVYLWE